MPGYRTHPLLGAFTLFGLAAFVFLLGGPAAAAPRPFTDTGSTVHFAVIGDYGSGGAGEAAVAALVRSWQPDLIITTGDNNYPAGESATIDQNIGQYYHDYICPYVGTYAPGSTVNRFFPSPGNHDWDSALKPDGHGLTVLPFLAGERSPGYRSDARAAAHALR